MASYQDFENRVLGKRYDIDGYFSAQCWDGYAEYCLYLSVPFANCTASGYVKDIWNQRHSNGILNHFVEVSTMQPGDVAVFFEHPATPLSHIAIFKGDAGNGYGWFLGQNQGGAGGAFNLVKMPYSATFATAFRPKAFINNTTTASKTTQPSPGINWVAENGVMTTHYAIYARESGPSTTNRSPYKFPAGSKIKYNAYCHANGYVWIRQPRSGGSYWYIPTGDSNGTRRTGKVWGTFE